MPCPSGQTSSEPSKDAPLKSRNVVSLPKTLELPTDTIQTEEVFMAGSGTVGFGILPSVIENYARSLGAMIKTVDADILLSGRGQGAYELYVQGHGKPFLRISISPGGTNNGILSLLNGKAQVGLAARAYTEAELARLIPPSDKRPIELIERVLALDAIVIIVNKDNPVQALTICEIARIFGGQSGTWRDYGGPSLAIRPYVLTAMSGTQDLLQNIFRQSCNIEIGKTAIPNATWEDMTKAVAADPGGIGFMAMTVLSSAVKPLRIKGKCGLDHSASRFNVKSEDYPLTRRLYYYTPVTVGRYAQAFLDHLQTTEAQAVVGQTQAIDLNVEMSGSARAVPSILVDDDLQQDPQMLRQFINDTRNAKQMSVTYRFRTNSAELDTRANQDITRLIAHLQSNPARGTLLIAGFADSLGSPEINRRLALERAEAVRNALLGVGVKLAADRIEVKGYGEIAPVACNDTEAGRSKNRRVEIWLRP